MLHYPQGDPGRPLEGGIEHTIHHAESLLSWFQAHTGVSRLPVALVGWSMGGVVTIEVAANILRKNALSDAKFNVRGVATIASMKEVQRDSPQLLVRNNVELLLMHNTNGKCKASNSFKIAKLAGGGVDP